MAFQPSWIWIFLNAAALAMVFKLVESAQARWRAITGAHLVALVPGRRQIRQRCRRGTLLGPRGMNHQAVCDPRAVT
jgi:hypothetical protein